MAVPLTPASPHEAHLAAALAFGETAGTFLVAGDPPPAVMLGVAAAAASLHLVDPTGVEPLEAWLGALMPPAVLPDDPGFLHEGLLVWDLPADDPERAFEAALARLGDGGRMFVSIPRRAGRDARVAALATGACGGRVVTWEQSARLVLLGVRRAADAPGALEEAPGQLPVSVIIPAAGASPALERLLCDVLLRQHYPPAEVFVLDLAPCGSGAIPADLFGLAERAACRVALFAKPDEPWCEAVDDALGGVGTAFVSILAPGLRLAPHHLATLGMLLEAAPRSGFAIPGHVDLTADDVPCAFRPGCPPDGERALRALLEGTWIPGRGELLRTDLARRVGGAAGGPLALAARLAARAPAGGVPAPLTASRPAFPDAGFGERDAALDAASVARLARDFPERPKATREAAARALRARVRLESDEPHAALAEIESCVAPDILIEAWRLVALFAAGHYAQALTAASGAGPVPSALAPLIAALAAERLGSPASPPLTAPDLAHLVATTAPRHRAALLELIARADCAELPPVFARLLARFQRAPSG